MLWSIFFICKVEIRKCASHYEILHLKSKFGLVSDLFALVDAT